MLDDDKMRKREFSTWLVDRTSHFTESDISRWAIILLLSPFALYLVMLILGFSYSIKFVMICCLISVIALVYALYIIIWIMKQDVDSPEMMKVANSIMEGSEGYFVAQYGTILKLSGLFGIGIMLTYFSRTTAVGISRLAMGLFSGLSFMFGALASSFSGYAGMWVSVRANVRVASAARTCYNAAMQVAFKGGYFSAVINVALAIFAICLLYLMMYFYMYLTTTGSTFTQIEEIPMLCIGFGFGASFVAMFAQLGGGIYTKAADVGADLIGKIEAGIPEDDPRNPAVIADLVGDNVGDCAGQCADLFESISAEILSAMILGSALATDAGFSYERKTSYMLFPLAVHCVDIIASTIGVVMVKTKPGLPDYDASYGELEDPLDLMKRGYRYALLCGTIGFFIISYWFLDNAWLSYGTCGLIGTILCFAFVEITQYYTDYRHAPVQSIVNASKTGHATNIIAGLSVGLESTAYPIVVIVFSLICSYYLGEASGIKNSKGQKIGGLFGTAIATMGMFSTGVFVLSMSGFGPIADNAGGIAEMSHQPAAVRKITDRLDAVGNVTKANTKGYSVGSAAMACFLLVSAVIDEINFISPKKFHVVDITIPEVFLGGLLGSMCVFLFTSWSLKAVGNTAQEVIREVKRQFAETPGILEGLALPNYKVCVELVAHAGLKEMIKPGLLSVLAPILTGFTFKIFGGLTGQELLGAKAISAFLMFSTATGILMALFLNNAGGAWDNAKKYIETGVHGGKGSQVHKAAVTGDTVGDPCKDTAGPSIHILIKLTATITLVLAPLFID